MVNFDSVLNSEMREWRRHLHKYPETAFTEHSTAQYIAGKLQSFGLEVHCGLGGTGVVAALSKGNSHAKIALRADMDALFIHEKNTFEYRSKNDGVMHACGHDGHCAMLLGAAKYLTLQGQFDGTVFFIFQPAEEGRAGAKRMIDEGLFELFPTDSVFGMHNFHDIAAGHFAVRSGPMMAAFDCFEIQLQGCATHAAMPHLGDDVILVAAQLITTLQSIVSRDVDPAEAAVLSITQIHGGQTWNALPESVMLRGTIRSFKSSVQQFISNRIQQIVASTCQCHEVTGSVTFNPENPGYPVTMNAGAPTELALKAATALVGPDKVYTHLPPSMGSEDFAYMLQEKPGCYIWIGNGPSNGSCLLHNPHYDFNDDILSVGAAYWVKLTEMVLPVKTGE